MTRRPPTIHDVARRAGVSITTVSHALNDRGRVADETRVRVRLAAEELGYSANPLAQRFRERRLRALGLVIRPLFAHATHRPEGVDYYARLAGEVSARALDHGYGVMLLGSQHTPVDFPLMMAFDGYLIAQPVRDDPLLSYLRGLGITTVTIGREVGAGPHPDAVDGFDYFDTQLLLGHLVGRGARSLWFVGGVADDSWNADVRRALSDVSANAGLRIREVRSPEEWGSEGGYQQVRRLLDDGGDLPDAVLCLTGRQACGAEQALLQRELRIPEDVLLAACIDAEQCVTSQVPITAISNVASTTAAAAVDHIIARIEGREPKQVRGLSDVIVRASTGGGPNLSPLAN